MGCCDVCSPLPYLDSRGNNDKRHAALKASSQKRVTEVLRSFVLESSQFRSAEAIRCRIPEFSYFDRVPKTTALRASTFDRSRREKGLKEWGKRSPVRTSPPKHDVGFSVEDKPHRMAWSNSEFVAPWSFCLGNGTIACIAALIVACNCSGFFFRLAVRISADMSNFVAEAANGDQLGAAPDVDLLPPPSARSIQPRPREKCALPPVR